MPEVITATDGAANDGAKVNLDEPNTTTVQLDLNESKAHLINEFNGGPTGDHVAVLRTQIIDTSASSSGNVPFCGLRKEEVMQYANDPFWVRLRWTLFILFWVGWLAMLVIAIVIIVLAPRCPPRPDLKWYQTETVYQVIPESFKDSNDDGFGDFEGLTDKLSYISTNLSVKAIWISSIFETDEKSSLGVLDHKAIKKSFGVSLEQFTGWLKKLRKEGLKVILDLIPNQTSKNHTWFQKSQQSDAHYKDYYIWANGTNGGPPSDWLTGAQGSDRAWSFDSVRNSWYLRTFPDCPDLNLANKFVKDEIKEIMKFWFDAGVSGFNIEGVEHLVEKPNLSSNTRMGPTGLVNYTDTLAFLEELRAVADAYSDKPGREKLLFASTENADVNQTLELWGTGEKKRLHIVTPRLLQSQNVYSSADALKIMIDGVLTDEGNQWLGIQLGNQNTPRIASRLDDANGNYKLRLVVAHALQLLLPGTPFNYYGDEFGQRNGNTSTANPLDKYRTPMQWNTQENAGFTSKGVLPWLPVGPDYKTDNVQVRTALFSGPTPFQSFQLLVKLRRSESFQWGKTQICAPHKDLLIFTRKSYRFPYFLILINTGSREVHVSPEELKCVSRKEVGKVVFHSQDKQVGEFLALKERGIQLDKFDVVVFEFSAEKE